MLKDMRIGKKLGLGFGFTTALLVIVGAVAIVGLYNALHGVGQYRAIAAVPVMLGRVQFNMLEAQLGESMSSDLEAVLDAASRSTSPSAAAAAGYALANMQKGRLAVADFLSNNDPATIDRVSESVGKDFSANLEGLRRGLSDADAARLVEKVERDRQQYLTGATTVRKAVFDGRALMADALDKVGPQIAKTADELKRVIRNEQIVLGEKVDAGAMTAMTVASIVALIGLLGSILLARALTKAIAAPIVAVAETARKFARGELDGEIAIRQKDEVGVLADSFRAMQGRLQGIVAQTGVLIGATKEGQLAVRADAEGFEGGWGQMIEGLNGLVDAYAAPIRMTAD